MPKPFAPVFSLCVALALCATLSSCGGGGSSATVPATTPPGVPAATPVIKFMGTFEPACGTCSPAKLGSLVIAPIAGATTLGSKDLTKVELSVDHAPTLLLTAPNATTTAGQASYAFSFPHATITTPAIGRTCTPQLGLEITITDVTGFVFKRYASACQYAVFGGFSDYGDKTVTYRASASAPAQTAFSRSDGSTYSDVISTTATTTVTSTLKAKDSNPVYASGSFDVGVLDGEILSVSIEGEGGAFASSTMAKKSVRQAEAFLICCGNSSATAPSTAETRTIRFAVGTVRYNEPLTKRPNPFNVYYKVSDPSTGAVITEFRGAVAGEINSYGAHYTEWQFTVKPGYELKLEASPQEVDTFVNLSITDTTNDPYAYPPMASAMSNRPDAPAKLNVFCCKP